ncbi:MAG: nucleoside-diphosphate kinase [Nitrospirota bacterium]
MERTFAIIKPDACKRNLAGKILAKIEEKGFRVIAMKKIAMTRKQAEGFYAVHRGKPFFDSLADFMSSGPCIVMVLEKENAIAAWRTLMGATNPANADPGTIRKEFAQSVEANSVHGSDAPETAEYEIKYFFSALELTA